MLRRPQPPSSLSPLMRALPLGREEANPRVLRKYFSKIPNAANSPPMITTSSANSELLICVAQHNFSNRRVWD